MITIEEIQGRKYTVVWRHLDDTIRNIIYWKKTIYGYIGFVSEDNDEHYATALPALPRKPKPEDAPLLYRYMAEGIILHGVDIRWRGTKDEERRKARYPYDKFDEITHATHNSQRVEIAIEEVI